MSTRCVVNFCYGSQVVAKIYRHSDGYPDGTHGVPHDLGRFFVAVEEGTNDRRFNDPSYLAAKFVVWQAEQRSHCTWRPSKGRFDFLGVGVVLEDPSDIEWIYFVDCDACDGDQPPAIRWERPR